MSLTLRERRRAHDVGPPAHSGRAAERFRVDGKFLRRGTSRLRLKGVTYGPFAPNDDGDPWPSPQQLQQDLEQWSELGVNALRVYHVPPAWLLERLSAHCGIGVHVDIPWSKHLCFLDSAQAQRDARHAVRAAVQQCQRHSSVLAYSIGNEIPPDVVRWHGAEKVERFLRDLYCVAKQEDPFALVTYGNFPPTEYLDLSFLDFVTFNVYLHDSEVFRRYLLRLQNLVGDKPLVLGEIGMDTLRHGELEQASFLAGHLEAAYLTGLAGAFIFSWTDDWHTGGHPITDWAFGVTDRQRTPKASYFAAGEVFEKSPWQMLQQTPRVSVVVCSYNGGPTLDQCLRSLMALDYPDFEVLLIDDGSSDDTKEIAARFPKVRAIHQSNQGLSVARNVGLALATGEIVAYTDSDCFADPDWLTHLVAQLETCNAAGVGGPNLAPEDGAVAAYVAACPGQPMHVLESNQVAEHVPGCNMAYRREALQAINGFDPQFRKAGDDVDLCWRLQQAGYWITFAPGAFVWHHRRQTPRAYFRQQAGYGEAEALLRFKHPDKFNAYGSGKWRGVLYGASLQGVVLDQAIIYRGVFGSGLFQSIYQPGAAHWAMLPSTLEWQGVAVSLGLLGATSLFMAAMAAVMLWLTVVVALIQAIQARIPRKYDSLRGRLLVGLLCWAQPIVRSWARYQRRYFCRRRDAAQALGAPRKRLVPLRQRCDRAYWGAGVDRVALLQQTIDALRQRHCGQTIDTGWSDYDLEVFWDAWTVVQVRTAQEELGSDRRVVRVAYRLRLSKIGKSLAALCLVATGLCASLNLGAAAVVGSLSALGIGGIWWRGALLKARIVELFDDAARSMQLVDCSARRETRRRRTEPVPSELGAAS
jgi:O-antigen biosynthesis protein